MFSLDDLSLCVHHHQRVRTPFMVRTHARACTRRTAHAALDARGRCRSMEYVPPRRACLYADFVRPRLGRPPARTAGRLSTGLYPQDDCPNALLGTGFTARVVNGQRTSLEVTSDIGTIELCIARLASGPSDPCPDHGPHNFVVFLFFPSINAYVRTCSALLSTIYPPLQQQRTHRPTASLRSTRRLRLGWAGGRGLGRVGSGRWL